MLERRRCVHNNLHTHAHTHTHKQTGAACSSWRAVHAIFSRVVCLLFSLLFNVRVASCGTCCRCSPCCCCWVGSVAFACCVYSKILNKLLPHLQLRKSMQNTKIHKQRRQQAQSVVLCGDRDVYARTHTLSHIHSLYI